MSDTTPRDLDIVIFGATGFVGRLTAAYLAEQAPAGVRIALAGRNHERLEEVRAGLPDAAAGWEIIVADASEPVTLAAVSYTHLRAHETVLDLVCRLLLEKKKRHK